MMKACLSKAPILILLVQLLSNEAAAQSVPSMPEPSSHDLASRTLGGLGFGALAEYAGLGTTSLMATFVGFSEGCFVVLFGESESCTGTAITLVAGYIGTSLLTPAAVTWGTRGGGGKGRYGWGLVGSLLGRSVGTSLTVLLEGQDFGVFSMLGAVGGALIALEIDHHVVFETERDAAFVAPSLAPTADLRGIQVGIVGTL